MEIRADKGTIKKLVNFTMAEWNFVQNYKHANKLKTDMDVIRDLIAQEVERRRGVIISVMNKSSGILKKLADK